MKDNMLEFKDAPMFSHVMHDKDLCKKVLEVILEVDIGDVEYTNTEQTFDTPDGSKGVRLDVFVRGLNKIFDIEMQTVNQSALMKRSRFYQGMMDTSSLNKGQDYSKLKESYVIFICTFDLFQRGLPVYHIESACLEDQSINVDDGAHRLILNTTAWNKDASQERSWLLEYIENGNAHDRLSKRIESEVNKANANEEWRQQAMGFMTAEMSHQAELSVAHETGVEQGEARNRMLVKKLLKDNRIEDLKRSVKDSAYCDTLYKEYNL